MGNHYQERVNRVLDHISIHLDGDLSLAALAGIACFSPFHFHRIFQGVTGETLNAHVRRVRLERAALLMRSSPRRRITDVALATGFAGAAEFSRAFKTHFGFAPSTWDRRSALDNSKIGKAPGEMPLHTVEELERWSAGQSIAVESLPAFRYVYQRIYAPYANTRLVDSYHELMRWVAGRKVVVAGMSLDDPSITPAENCRYDLGAAFFDNPPAEAPEGFSIRDFEPLDIVAVHCIGDIHQVLYAWQYLYRVWLPASGYVPADLPAMELFVRLPEEIGWTTFDLKTCIPVVRY